MSQRLEHRVVPCKIAHGDEIEPGIALFTPMTSPKRAADLEQLRLVNFSLPEGVESELELAIAADSGIAEHVGDWHRSNSSYSID
jgi:hypothetical protein